MTVASPFSHAVTLGSQISDRGESSVPVAASSLWLAMILLDVCGRDFVVELVSEHPLDSFWRRVNSNRRAYE